jgi:hypothetical protein
MIKISNVPSRDLCAPFGDVVLVLAGVATWYQDASGWL